MHILILRKRFKLESIKDLILKAPFNPLNWFYEIFCSGNLKEKKREGRRRGTWLSAKKKIKKKMLINLIIKHIGIYWGRGGETNQHSLK